MGDVCARVCERERRNYQKKREREREMKKDGKEVWEEEEVCVLSSVVCVCVCGGGVYMSV